MLKKLRLVSDVSTIERRANDMDMTHADPNVEVRDGKRWGLPPWSRYLDLGVIALFGILLVLTFRIVVTPLSGYDKKHPSDPELERVFRDHQTDFNQLITMSNMDSKVVRIAPTFTWLEDNARWPRPETELGFSVQRWDEYREMFKRLGLKQGIARDEDGRTIEFIASSTGLLTGGSGKGYVYSTKELSPIYESLDDLEPTGKYVYKKLQPPHWYLFYYSK